MKPSEWRFPEFTERFRELRGERDNTEFGKFLGISRQTVGFYCNGDRIPDALGLKQIAEKCGVSADWLLGLTNDPHKIPIAVDKLKLSPEVVDILTKRLTNGIIDYDASDFVNVVVGSQHFVSILRYYSDAIALTALKRKAEQHDALEPDESKVTATDYLTDESYGALETMLFDGAVYVPLDDAIRMYTRSISDAVFIILSDAIDEKANETVTRSQDE